MPDKASPGERIAIFDLGDEMNFFTSASGNHHPFFGLAMSP
jgi:hypothetical protein